MSDTGKVPYFVGGRSYGLTATTLIFQRKKIFAATIQGTTAWL